MSWEAVQWANKQRLRLPQEQFVLIMLANCADPEGVAFSWWTRKEHWWKYLVDHTRLSRTTIFRHLSTIEELGLGIRQKTVLPDGTARFTMLLDLAKFVVVESEEKDETAAEEEPQSHGGTQSGDGTQSHGGTESVPLVGLHIEALSESNKPPNPPLGGGDSVELELEEDLADMAREYPIPITNLPKLRNLMRSMARVTRRSIVTAAKGYAEFLRREERKGKKRSAKDADRWVASGMWQGYVPAGEKAEVAAAQTRVPVDSAAGKAWAVLHKIAHMRPFETGGMYLLPRPLSAQALALAQAPPEDDWKFISGENTNQCGAYTELIARELAGKSRPPLVWDRNPGGALGFFAPYPWPPRKDGSLCTGPPSGELTTADAHEFAK